MIRQQCGCCHYFHHGECRRYAPNSDGWPNIRQTDCCGEWAVGFGIMPKDDEQGVTEHVITGHVCCVDETWDYRPHPCSSISVQCHDTTEVIRNIPMGDIVVDLGEQVTLTVKKNDEETEAK